MGRVDPDIDEELHKHFAPRGGTTGISTPSLGPGFYSWRASIFAIGIGTGLVKLSRSLASTRLPLGQACSEVFRAHGVGVGWEIPLSTNVDENRPAPCNTGDVVAVFGDDDWTLKAVIPQWFTWAPFSTCNTVITTMIQELRKSLSDRPSRLLQGLTSY